MDEFGETPSIYVWPTGHEEGESFGDDFWQRLGKALNDAGFEWEAV